MPNGFNLVAQKPKSNGRKVVLLPPLALCAASSGPHPCCASIVPACFRSPCFPWVATASHSQPPACVAAFAAVYRHQHDATQFG